NHVHVATHALHYDVLPDRLVTVFAGQDKEATQRARDYFEGYAPSSPSFALMKDGKITEMIERHQIEGHDTMDVITQLQALFDRYCNAK
ncbi:BrxA/BrxB family bacilliredoxin, partial [Staphylococcus pseudintermedius]